MFKKLNKKGFTLAELLVVVAIIGVLVAISIPIFTTQLEKSREAVDLANIRSVYAEVQTAALTDLGATSEFEDDDSIQRSGSDGSYVWTATVTLTQKQNDWQGAVDKIGGIDISSTHPKVSGTCTVTYTQNTDTSAITFSTT